MTYTPINPDQDMAADDRHTLRFHPTPTSAPFLETTGSR